MFFKQRRNNVSTLTEVVVVPWMAVVPLPPLCWSAPALGHSCTKANMTFVGGLFFPKMKCLCTERQEALRQPVAGLQCQTQRQQPASMPGSAHPLAAMLGGQAGRGTQQCYLEIAIFAITARIFKCFLLPAQGLLSMLPSRPCRNEGAQW